MSAARLDLKTDAGWKQGPAFESPSFERVRAAAAELATFTNISAMRITATPPDDTPFVVWTWDQDRGWRMSA